MKHFAELLADTRFFGFALLATVWPATSHAWVNTSVPATAITVLDLQGKPLPFMGVKAVDSFVHGYGLCGQAPPTYICGNGQTTFDRTALADSGGTAQLPARRIKSSLSQIDASEPSSDYWPAAVFPCDTYGKPGKVAVWPLYAPITGISPSFDLESGRLRDGFISVHGSSNIGHIPSSVRITVSDDTRAAIEVLRHRFFEEGTGAISCDNEAEDLLGQ